MIRRPGPPSKEEGSISNAELLSNPYARVLYNTRLAEKMYLPFIRAKTSEDVSVYTDYIDEALGLTYAKEQGLIRDWTISWSQNGYPKIPLGVRLFPPICVDKPKSRGWEDFVSRAFIQALRSLNL